MTIAERLKLLTPTERELLALLQRLSARRSGLCWPGRRWLATKLGVTIRTIGRAIRTLVDLGAIIRRRQGQKTASTVIRETNQNVPSATPLSGSSIKREGSNNKHGDVVWKKRRSRDGIPHIEISDLRDANRLKDIHTAAASAGLAPVGRRGLCDVVAMAVHAMSYREKKTGNSAKSPASLFAWMIRTKRFDWITGKDEDEASRILVKFGV